MAAVVMIREIKTWAPVAVGMIVMLLAIIASLHTHRPVIRLASLPAPIHVSSAHIDDTDAETRAPLFAPSRSILPAGADGQAAQDPPPALTGIVVGGGRSVALLKTAKGDTVMAHAGDTVDGWTLVSIAPRAILVARGGVQRTVELVFGSAPPAAAARPLSAIAPTSHEPMAAPSFDGLAAARRRGLPEANIPLGSPLRLGR